MSSETKYWLLKAEPDTRIVKGKDVKVGLSRVLLKTSSDPNLVLLIVQRRRL